MHFFVDDALSVGGERMATAVSLNRLWRPPLMDVPLGIYGSRGCGSLFSSNACILHKNMWMSEAHNPGTANMIPFRRFLKGIWGDPKTAEEARMVRALCAWRSADPIDTFKMGMLVQKAFASDRHPPSDRLCLAGVRATSYLIDAAALCRLDKVHGLDEAVRALPTTTLPLVLQYYAESCNRHPVSTKDNVALFQTMSVALIRVLAWPWAQVWPWGNGVLQGGERDVGMEEKKKKDATRALQAVQVALPYIIASYAKMPPCVRDEFRDVLLASAPDAILVQGVLRVFIDWCELKAVAFPCQSTARLFIALMREVHDRERDRIRDSCRGLGRWKENGSSMIVDVTVARGNAWLVSALRSGMDDIADQRDVCQVFDRMPFRYVPDLLKYMLRTRSGLHGIQSTRDAYLGLLRRLHDERNEGGGGLECIKAVSPEDHVIAALGIGDVDKVLTACPSLLFCPAARDIVVYKWTLDAKILWVRTALSPRTVMAMASMIQASQQPSTVVTSTIGFVHGAQRGGSGVEVREQDAAAALIVIERFLQEAVKRTERAA